MEINDDKFETPIPVGQIENRVSEAQKSPENAPEVSRSCQNFPRPACFKVPLYTPISIQSNLLVLETLPPVVLGHFLLFLKEKRWNKYNQPFLSCHATLLPKGTAAHARTKFLISFLRLGGTMCSQKGQIPAQCHEQAHEKAWVLSWGICTHLTWRPTEQV